MKLSKTAQWILIIGILAVLLVSAGVLYGRQTAERSHLNSDIARANQDFITYTALRADLETKLSQAKSELASCQGEFHEPTESIEISEALFETADDANVTIISLRSSTPKGGELGGTTYQVFSLSLQVKGDNMAQLLGFTNKLSDRFPDATIESGRISISEEQSTLTLKLKAYTL